MPLIWFPPPPSTPPSISPSPPVLEQAEVAIRSEKTAPARSACARATRVYRVAAVNVDTGKMVWAFQTSPHDMHDWDSAQTPILIDGVIDVAGAHDNNILVGASYVVVRNLVLKGAKADAKSPMPFAASWKSKCAPKWPNSARSGRRGVANLLTRDQIRWPTSRAGRRWPRPSRRAGTAAHHEAGRDLEVQLVGTGAGRRRDDRAGSPVLRHGVERDVEQGEESGCAA